MTSTLPSQMKVYTPELLWHGGGNESGKPDPVYSVDFHPSENILSTSGIDDSVPPKGSVRLWKVTSNTEGQEFLIDLCDHQSVVHIARFSPCGKMLASASEKQIVIYVVSDASSWSTVTDVRSLERIWLRPSLNEIFDMTWSPDSAYLLFGAIDAKAEIIRVATRDNLILSGHTNYVQGVAWDPLNTMVATQSSDRSIKIHQLKYKEGTMVKLAQKGHSVIRMHGGYANKDVTAENRPLSATDFGMVTTESGEVVAAAAPASQQGINLYADSYVPSFFRRLCFSPDGALLFTPTGIHRPPSNDTNKTTSSSGQKNSSSSSGSSGTTVAGAASKSFCTHIYSRNQLSTPCLSLVGLDEPSVAVRCCPRLFKLLPSAQETPLIPGDYRVVFAVVTIKSIFLYDSQHPHPFAKLSGLHLAPINDAAWSGDGNMLAACSSDGYLTFVRFPAGSLGEVLEDAEVPEVVRKTNPCLYHYTPPVTSAAATAVPPAASTGSKAASSVAAAATDEDKSSVVASDPTTSDKKRKRIQPVMIAALDSAISGSGALSFGGVVPSPSHTVAASTNSDNSSSTPIKVNPATEADDAADKFSSPVLVDSTSADSTTSSKAVEEIVGGGGSTSSSNVNTSVSDVNGSAKKEKKRIAPTLITPL